MFPLPAVPRASNTCDPYPLLFCPIPSFEPQGARSTQKHPEAPTDSLPQTPAASSDALYILEKTTSAIISHISTYLSDHAGELGGTTSVPDAKSPVQLPTAPLALPQLQRLRRQFVALYRRQEGRMDAERVGEAFVEFLNGQWGGEEG